MRSIYPMPLTGPEGGALPGAIRTLSIALISKIRGKKKEKEMSAKIIAAPSQKTISDARTALDNATLATIAGVAGDAGAALTRMAGAATALKGSIVEATLRVVSKEKIADVIEPLKLTIGAAGKAVSNLSTIRTATIKMIVAYGAEHSLPLWAKVSEAKESGDAAVTAALGACITYAGTDGSGHPTNPQIDAAARDVVLGKIGDACRMFALSEDSIGKVRGVYFAALQGMVEAADEAAAEAQAADEADENAQIVADAAATLEAELIELRAIAVHARRIMGMPDATGEELIAEMARTDAAD